MLLYDIMLNDSDLLHLSAEVLEDLGAIEVCYHDSLYEFSSVQSIIPLHV